MMILMKKMMRTMIKMATKLLRYHKDVYFPLWSYNSIRVFWDKMIEEKVILFTSYHAKKKMDRMKGKYRSATKKIMADGFFSEENLKYIFEFYANDKKVVKKICVRMPLIDGEVDIIIVISAIGKVITVYLNNNFDNHNELDRSLYVLPEVA